MSSGPDNCPVRGSFAHATIQQNKTEHFAILFACETEAARSAIVDVFLDVYDGLGRISPTFTALSVEIKTGANFNENCFRQSSHSQKKRAFAVTHLDG